MAVDELIDRLADELAAGGARDVTVEAAARRRDRRVVGEGQGRAQAGADAAQRGDRRLGCRRGHPWRRHVGVVVVLGPRRPGGGPAQPVERGVREARFAREDDQRITPIVHVPGAMAA